MGYFYEFQIEILWFKWIKKHRICTNSGNEDNVWNRTQKNRQLNTVQNVNECMCEFKSIWHEIWSIALQSNAHFCFNRWVHFHAKFTNMINLHVFLCFQSFRPSILLSARWKKISSVMIAVKRIISTFHFACDDLFLIWPDHCKLHAYF